MQILEGRGETLEVACLQESPQARFMRAASRIDL